MSNKFLYIAWGALYAACAGLGFIAAPEGAAYGLCIFFSLVFFVPPFLLLNRAIQEGRTKTVRFFRILSLIWLITALVLILLNILSVLASQTVGVILYYMLILFTAPMICGQIWIISLFLWACLLMMTLMKKK